MSLPLSFAKVIVPFSFNEAVTSETSLLITLTNSLAEVWIATSSPFIENRAPCWKVAFSNDVNSLNALAVAPWTDVFVLIWIAKNLAASALLALKLTAKAVEPEIKFSPFNLIAPVGKVAAE